jgi:hypothetical protein
LTFFQIPQFTENALAALDMAFIAAKAMKKPLIHLRRRSEDMPENQPERISINSLHQEEGAHELATSPEMEPYLRLIMARMQGVDATQELDAIRQLPLEKRYVWRVASALKWAFADCESESVKADRETLPAEDLSGVRELLEVRPMQFCLFLAALVGVEEMQRVMVQAIQVARQHG